MASQSTSPGVITRYADAWVAGDFATLVACYSEGFVAHYGGQSPFAGTHIGRDRFLEILMTTATRAQRQLVSIDQLHDDGATGALFVTESIVVDGTSMRVLRALRYRTSDDLLTECWLYDHDQHVVDHAWTTDLP
jgi:uncharacterized protein